jgi:hypothetical protein
MVDAALHIEDDRSFRSLGSPVMATPLNTELRYRRPPQQEEQEQEEACSRSTHPPYIGRTIAESR